MRNCYIDARGRFRCDDDNKVAYQTEREAVEALAFRQSFTRTQLRVYQSECGYWHFTSNSGT